MQVFGSWTQNLAALAVLYCSCSVVNASTITAPIASPTAATSRTTPMAANGTCESRTINYITHGLPQVCLRYPRIDLAGLEATSVTTKEINGALKSPSPVATISHQINPVSSSGPDESPGLDSDSALDESSFLSFEDWKKQTLEKESLLDSAAGDKRFQAFKDDRRRNPDGIQEALKVLEEDITIDTDFAAFLGDVKETSHQKAPQDEDNLEKQTTQDMVDNTNVDPRPRYRSEDTGKTCKERFNFASLDVGAQVMKTNSEARSASALLKEDRDVYMLNTCQAKNKFIIVELSESILVETVAIANFEFFSSTFRQFRISVSDRYPTTLDRWVDLGTFEARNLRDIQAFLVQDPRIWARYFRLEFLSHYGNEFYCPISLLRVHGRTMIQDVLNMEESIRVEDDIEDNVEEAIGGNVELVTAEEVRNEEKRVADGLKEAEEAIEDLVRIAETITSQPITDALNSSQLSYVKRWLGEVSTEQMTTPWNEAELRLASLFSGSYHISVCLLSDSPASQASFQQSASVTGIEPFDREYSPKALPTFTTKSDALPDSTRDSMAESKEWSGDQMIANRHPSISAPLGSISSTLASIGEPSSSRVPSVPSITPNVTVTGNNKSLNKASVISTSHSSQPATQESFFKTVSKRLQLLEANSTLSLKYIEEQSKILRDAFAKVEKRQLAKTTFFLESLNDTVLDELRRFSQQYDQIWQSTVVELETQRDKSQREIAAVSTRLSMLADELVFQKRMSIVQSILLLLCLGLVVLSRGPGYLEQHVAGRSRSAVVVPSGNPSSSLVTQKGRLPLEQRSWHGARHTRYISDESIGSLRSQSPEYSPPTPFSSYSRQEEELTKDIDEIGLHERVDKTFSGASSEEQRSFSPKGLDLNSGRWQESDIVQEKTTRVTIIQISGMRGSGQGNEPHYDGDNDGSFKAPNLSNGDENIAQASGGRFRRPLRPPETEKPEFSIARKPLPALPKADC